jgi:hypothetical protein
LTTPKQVARSIVIYGKKHPELNVSSFVIPQVDGLVERSHKVHGIAESLIKSKRYIVPLVILTPHVAGGILVAYLAGGQLNLPKNAVVFDLDEARVKVQPTPDVTAAGEEEKMPEVGTIAAMQVGAN